MILREDSPPVRNVICHLSLELGMYLVMWMLTCTTSWLLWWKQHVCKIWSVTSAWWFRCQATLLCPLCRIHFSHCIIDWRRHHCNGSLTIVTFWCVWFVWVFPRGFLRVYFWFFWVFFWWVHSGCRWFFWGFFFWWVCLSCLWVFWDYLLGLITFFLNSNINSIRIHGENDNID